jgi:C-terminal processing protease CtpA/Prc
LLSYLVAKPLTISMYRSGGKPTFLPQTIRKDKEYKQTYNLFPKMRKKWGVSTTKNDTFYRIDYTNKVKKNSYKGNLFVLTNGFTFSASGIVSAHLRNEKRATFIGVETGGCEEGSNGFNVPTLILPNTKLLYTLPLFRLDHEGVNVAKKGRGIFPDYPMQYSVEDYLTNRDMEMEQVRALIKK